MRQELIVCDKCKATRDEKEPGGAVMHICQRNGESFIADLCDGCVAFILERAHLKPGEKERDCTRLTVK